MSIKCLLNKHAWDGCVCARCGQTRDEGHAWDGCVCTRCGQKRDEGHAWNGCVCEKCFKTRHQYEVIEEGENRPTCKWDANEPCTGPNCGTWCDSYSGPGYKYTVYKCSRCGKVRREETEL